MTSVILHFSDNLLFMVFINCYRDTSEVKCMVFINCYRGTSEVKSSSIYMFFFIIGYFASVYRCCDICLFCFHYFYYVLYVLYVFYFSVLSFLYYILLIRVHLENNLHQPKYYMYKLFITKSLNICETIQDFNHTQYIPFHRNILLTL